MDKYWSEQQNELIDNYVDGEDSSKGKRDQIYSTKIYTALQKLISGVKNSFQYYSTSDTELQSHLFEVLDTSRRTEMYYDVEKPTTPFNYLTTVVRNYCIQNRKSRKKKDDTEMEFEAGVFSAKKAASSEIDYALFLEQFENYLSHNRFELFEPKEQLYVDFYIHALTKDQSLINTRTQLTDIREWTDQDIDGEHYHKFKIKFNNCFECLITQFRYTGSINKDFGVSLYL